MASTFMINPIAQKTKMLTFANKGFLNNEKPTGNY